MAEVDVRRSGPEQWRDWRHLRLRALAESPAAFGSTLQHEETYVEADWRRLTDDTVLAYDAGRPVSMGAGFAEDRPGHMMVVAMWTEPDHRGLGIGGKVLDEIVALARSRGLVPHLFVMHANPAAGRLYERHGFVRSGLVENHGGRDADQLVLGDLRGQAEP